jgi:hypothetical protein
MEVATIALENILSLGSNGSRKQHSRQSFLKRMWKEKKSSIIKYGFRFAWPYVEKVLTITLPFLFLVYLIWQNATKKRSASLCYLAVLTLWQHMYPAYFLRFGMFDPESHKSVSQGTQIFADVFHSLFLYLIHWFFPFSYDLSYIHFFIVVFEIFSGPKVAWIRYIFFLYPWMFAILNVVFSSSFIVFCATGCFAYILWEDEASCKKIRSTFGPPSAQGNTLSIFPPRIVYVWFGLTWYCILSFLLFRWPSQRIVTCSLFLISCLFRIEGDVQFFHEKLGDFQTWIHWLANSIQMFLDFRKVVMQTWFPLFSLLDVLGIVLQIVLFTGYALTNSIPSWKMIIFWWLPIPVVCQIACFAFYFIEHVITDTIFSKQYQQSDHVRVVASQQAQTESAESSVLQTLTDYCLNCFSSLWKRAQPGINNLYFWKKKTPQELAEEKKTASTNNLKLKSRQVRMMRKMMRKRGTK